MKISNLLIIFTSKLGKTLTKFCEANRAIGGQRPRPKHFSSTGCALQNLEE